MIRSAGLCAIFTFLVVSGFAQEETAAPTRLATHYIGIQANQLLRQLFSLSNTSAPINNPYLMTYSVNSNATGVGLNLGLALNYNQFGDDVGTLHRETKINDFSFRIGIEKKSVLSKKWILACGADIVIDNTKNSTKTTDPVSSSQTSETTSKITGWGLGPRVAIYYQIGEKILLGTEANYYFKSLTTTNEFKDSFSSDKDEIDIKRFQLNVPAVIFLVLKL